MTFIKNKWEVRKDKLIFRLLIAGNILYFIFAAFGVYSLATIKPPDAHMELIECKETLGDIRQREEASRGLYEELSGDVREYFGEEE